MSAEVTLDPLPPWPAEREAHRAQANRDERVARVARALRGAGRVEPLKGLDLNRAASPLGTVHIVSGPASCVIAHGQQGLDAARAAGRVGYANASHFNREYKRLFGLPPMRAVERRREAAR